MKKQILALTFAGLLFSGQVSASQGANPFDSNIKEIVKTLGQTAIRDYGVKGTKLLINAVEKAITEQQASLDLSTQEINNAADFLKWAEGVITPALPYAKLAIAAVYLEPWLDYAGSKVVNFWDTSTPADEDGARADAAAVALRDEANPRHAQETIFNAQRTITHAQNDGDFWAGVRQLEEATRELRFFNQKLLQIDGFALAAAAPHAGRAHQQAGLAALDAVVDALNQIRTGTHLIIAAAAGHGGGAAPAPIFHGAGGGWFAWGGGGAAPMGLNAHQQAAYHASQQLLTAAQEFERAQLSVETEHRLTLFPGSAWGWPSLRRFKPSEMSRRRLQTAVVFGALYKLSKMLP